MALDERLEELRNQHLEIPDTVFQHAFREQLELLGERLGGSARERALIRIIEETSELVEEIPVVNLLELPPAWSDFQPQFSFEQPGVGQIYFSSQKGGDSVTGTGWLFVPENGRRDLVVTNAHVVIQIAATVGVATSALSEAQIRRIEITFAPVVSDESQYYRVSAFHVDSCFDLAVLRLESDLPEEIVGFSLTEAPLQSGDKVVALGYPGRLAVFTEEDREAYKRNFPYPPYTRVASPGRVRQVCGFRVEHTCTLAPGSSGSPLVDLSGRVAGVHYYGERWKHNLAVAAPELHRMLTTMEL